MDTKEFLDRHLIKDLDVFTTGDKFYQLDDLLEKYAEEYHQAKLKSMVSSSDVSESVLCQDCFKPVDKGDNWCKHCGEVIV